MPTIMIRQLDRQTADRLRAYARSKTLSTSAAAAQLLTIALDHLDARTSAGKAAHVGKSAADRSASASLAATARWSRTRTTE